MDPPMPLVGGPAANARCLNLPSLVPRNVYSVNHLVVAWVMLLCPEEASMAVVHHDLQERQPQGSRMLSGLTRGSEQQSSFRGRLAAWRH